MNYLANYTKFAVITLCLLALSVTAFGDVKIKSRQTMSGQTFENTTYIKGKRQRTEMMNGMSVNLTQCDLRRGVQLNPNTKTYVVNSFDQDQSAIGNQQSAIKNDGVVRAGGTVTMTVTTKDTGERKQMFGFTAKRLIITMETASSPDACAVTNTKMEMDGWYIDAEFAFDCGQYSGYQSYGSSKKAGCQDKYQTKQIGTAKRGYPVYEKMTMFDGKGKESFSTVTEVIELSKATLSADLFEIPADYREVADASAMYAAVPTPANPGGADSPVSHSGINQNVKDLTENSANTDFAQEISAKKEGVIRIGMVNVKTVAVGEGLSGADLAAAIQNSLSEYLKTPGVEVVQLEAKLPSAITAEAQQKECDYVIIANVSHKKGGSGFGGVFGKVIAPSIGQTGIGQTGSVAGNIAGQVATRSIVTAGMMAANVKSKDQISLEIKLQTFSGTAALNKKFEGKAKSDGEDIITPLIEQAAQAVINTVGKK